MTTVSTSDSGKEKVKKKKKEVFKVILRRLPPYITWEELKEQLDPLPEYDFVSFCPADLSFAPHAFSRCYFNFLTEQDVLEFSEKFNRYVFVDKKGFDSVSVVELAAYQKGPKKTKEDMAKDPRCGIIEQEPEYLRFVDELEEKRKKSNLTIEEQINRIVSIEFANKNNRNVQQTPLTQYLLKVNDDLYKKREDKRKALDKFRKPRETRDYRAERDRFEKEPKENIRVLQREKNGESSRDIDEAASQLMKKLGVGSSTIEERSVQVLPRPPPPRSATREKTQPTSSQQRHRFNDAKKKDRPDREIYRPGQRSRKVEGEGT